MLKKPDSASDSGYGAPAQQAKQKKRVRIRTESGTLLETTDASPPDGRTTSAFINMRVTDKGIFVICPPSSSSSSSSPAGGLGADAYGRLGPPGAYPPVQSGYAELDATLVPPGAQQMAMGPPGNHFQGPSGPDDRFGEFNSSYRHLHLVRIDTFLFFFCKKVNKDI
jgi:hypothetical protein